MPRLLGVAEAGAWNADRGTCAPRGPIVNQAPRRPSDALTPDLLRFTRTPGATRNERWERKPIETLRHQSCSGVVASDERGRVAVDPAHRCAQIARDRPKGSLNYRARAVGPQIEPLFHQQTSRVAGPRNQ
jgi:hypothetical protein